jgi:hypothetical protein
MVSFRVTSEMLKLARLAALTMVAPCTMFPPA